MDNRRVVTATQFQAMVASVAYDLWEKGAADRARRDWEQAMAELRPLLHRDPRPEEIRGRAHAIWSARQDHDAFSHWLYAKRLVSIDNRCVS